MRMHAQGMFVDRILRKRDDPQRFLYETVEATLSDIGNTSEAPNFLVANVRFRQQTDRLRPRLTLGYDWMVYRPRGASPGFHFGVEVVDTGASESDELLATLRVKGLRSFSLGYLDDLTRRTVEAIENNTAYRVSEVHGAPPRYNTQSFSIKQYDGPIELGVIGEMPQSFLLEQFRI